MKTKIRLLTLSLFLAVITIANAQDCESLRAKAQQLDTQRQQQDTGEAHFQYGLFLTSLIVAQNNCIDSSVLYEFQSAYAIAADKGHARAGARLALTNYYGLLNKPMRYKRAYEVSEVMISKMVRAGLDSDFDEYGWMNATILLDLAERMDKDIKTDEYTLAVFKLVENFEPEPKKPDAPNSEDRIRYDLSAVKKEAYLNGSYGMEPDYDKALTYAGYNDWGSFYSTYVYLQEENKLGEDRPNNALELFMAMHYIKQMVFRTATRDYAVKILNKHVNTFTSSSDFETTLASNSKKWVEWNSRSFADYDSNSQMFEAIKSSRFIEDKTGLSGWKFLPKSEKNQLFATAISEDSEVMESEKRFSIFKAMELNDETRSYYWMAKAYQNGQGVYSDMDKAIQYYNKAINSGNYADEARMGLAKIYDDEEGYQDWNKAFTLYAALKSSDKFPKAIKEWAEMTYMGLGGANVNRAAAKEAFEKCANLGNKECAENLWIAQLMENQLETLEKPEFTLTPMSRIGKVINLEDSGMEFTYDVKVNPNNEEHTVELMVYKDDNYPSIFYRNYSPSSGPIKESDQYTAKVFPSYRGYRDFGFLSIAYKFNDDARFLNQVPMAVYYLPKKE
jgi:TPR repeat protein